MYIKNFHIEEFGPLKDFTVDDIPCAVAVFLGKNEAGKSSSMEFIRNMLMGIPNKRNAMTQTIKNSKGGHLLMHDSTHGDIKIVRNFQDNTNQIQLFDSLGNKQKENILTEMLSGVSREVYRMIFGFNLVELQNVSSFHGPEVFNTILGASFGLGLRGPALALDQIQEQMDKLYKTRGKNSVLQKLFDNWNSNKELLDGAYRDLTQFEALQDEQKKLEASLAEFELERNDKLKKNEELQFLLTNYPQWEKWAECQNVLEKLPPVTVSFPQNAELVLEKILEQKKIKERNIDSFNMKLDEMEANYKENPRDIFLFAEQKNIQKLMEDKGAYRIALTDYTGLMFKKEQFLPNLSDASANLKLKWTLLDGQSSDREKLNHNALADYIQKISHGDDFISTFAGHEIKIMKAEAATQNAMNALDSAHKDLDEVEDKKQTLMREFAEEREKFLEKVIPEMDMDFVEQHLDLLERGKIAMEKIPAYSEQGNLAFENWENQVEKLNIINPMSQPELFQNLEGLDLSHIHRDLIPDQDDQIYYAYTSYIVKMICEHEEKIFSIGEQFTEDSEAGNNLKENLAEINAEIENLLEESRGGVGQEVVARQNEHLESQNQALQKLQTIDELRTKAISDLKQLNREQEELYHASTDNQISRLTYLPGIFSSIFSIAFFAVRFFSGQDYILLEQSQNIFFSFLSNFTTSLYIPYWLSGILSAFSVLSLALPFGKDKAYRNNQADFSTVRSRLTRTIENLSNLKNDDIKLIENNFGLDESSQFGFYGKMFQTDEPVNNDKLSKTSLSLDSEESTNNAFNQNLLEEAEKLDEPVTMLETATSYNLNYKSILKIIEDNELYQKMVNNLYLELKKAWEEEYEFFISREENHLSDEDRAKYESLLSKRSFYENLLAKHTEIIQEHTQEWEKLFGEFFLREIPPINEMDEFLSKLEASRDLERQFLEINEEYKNFFLIVFNVQEFAQKYFDNILQTSIFNEKIRFPQLILKLEKKILEIKELLVANDAESTEKQNLALEQTNQEIESAKKQINSIQEEINNHKILVDEAYNECVDFLCSANIISDENSKEYFERMQFEKIDNFDNSMEQNFFKKIDLNLVKKFIEAVVRFESTVTEYNSIKNKLEASSETISKFESTLKSIMESAKFENKVEVDGQLDALATFENLYESLQEEVSKMHSENSMSRFFSDFMREVEDVQNDLEEINESLSTLFDMAGVETEAQLRELIEVQRHYQDAVNNSLQIENSFKNMRLPQYLEKSVNPYLRQFELEEEQIALPEIFEYFDEECAERWQNDSAELKAELGSLDNKLNELQNRNGALKAKCDAIVESTSFDQLKLEQIKIEESIEEAYEKWLELSFTKQVIQRARKQYELERQPKVIALASEYFATITNQAWEKIYVSLEEKDIKILDKSGIPLSTEILSQGAKEQLYLALRLAHIKNRSFTHNALPILMDDILVNFDSERIQNTVDLLNKIIVQDTETENMTYTDSSQQILYYTCHEDTAELLQQKIPNTKIYLVEDKKIRPLA